MRLRLHIAGIDFQLKVCGWHVTGEHEDYYDNWCSIELNLSGTVNLNLDGSMLMSDEISELCSAMEKSCRGLLADTLNLDFLEPDFVLVLYAGEKRKPDLVGKWIINLEYTGYPAGTYLSVGLSERDVSAMCLYLKLVTKQLKADDHAVVKLKQEGKLLPE